MNGTPAFQFYPGDWRRDLGVQTLSYHHRGIWFEILMLMHCSEQRGRLVLAGKPMPNASLARLLGLSERESEDAVNVIVASGVADRELDGTLICRRMVREENRLERLRGNASKGGSKTSSKRQATPYEVEDEDEVRVRGRVREFARGEGIGERDADWFFYKCQGNGWTNGGKPIRDWKATIQCWWRGGFFPSQKPSNNGQRHYRNGPEETIEQRKKRMIRASQQREKKEEAEVQRTDEVQRQKVLVLAQTEVQKLRDQFKMP